jgi:hypothetical protein
VETANLFRKSVHLILQVPYAWLLALLAVVGDAWAVLTYGATSVDLSANVIWLTLLTFIAETSLIYSFGQQVRGKPSRFIDSVMTAITCVLQTLGGKLILLIVPAICGAALLIFSPVLISFLLEEHPGLAMMPLQLPPSTLRNIVLLLSIPTLPLLLLNQVWTFFTSCGILIQGYSVGEAIAHAWWVLWTNKKRIILVILLFVLVDLLLITALVGMRAVSIESAFRYTVTEEMAEYNARLDSGFIEAGDYFLVDRPINGFLAATLKGRVADLLSIPLYITDGRIAGSAVAALEVVLLLLRVSVFTSAYIELAEPTDELKGTLHDIVRRSPH